MALTTIIGKTIFHVGDTVGVHYKIIEKEVVSGKTKREKHEEQKERIQVFDGVVLAIKGGGGNQSFTVRHSGAAGIAIERIFPTASPWIQKITVLKKGKVRRAKLYYLRTKTAKEAGRISERKEIVSDVIPSTKPVHANAQPKAG